MAKETRKQCKNCGIWFRSIYGSCYCSDGCRRKQANKSAKIKKQKTGCEVCGTRIAYCLDTHHCVPKNKRDGIASDKAVLCANCHHIIHHLIGWGRDFIDVLTKEQTLELIKKEYKNNL